jgi:hypothetical protein
MDVDDIFEIKITTSGKVYLYFNLMNDNNIAGYKYKIITGQDTTIGYHKNSLEPCTPHMYFPMSFLNKTEVHLTIEPYIGEDYLVTKEFKPFSITTEMLLDYLEKNQIYYIKTIHRFVDKVLLLPESDIKLKKIFEYCSKYEHVRDVNAKNFQDIQFSDLFD